MTATSISRRVEKSIESLGERDYENAFVQLFPALDKTAKKRRPKEGVGSRIKNFISDEEAIITAVATNNIFKGMNVDGIDLPTALYKFGRTSIVHEGELDERLNINEHGRIEIGKVWNLSSSYITGLIVSVIIAPENNNEKIEKDFNISLFGTNYKVNELWGEIEIVKKRMCNLWKNDDLFK